ncbi:sensor histidine kinase [Xylophilus ampelinus]|uniref:histidine kinase n=1 Tax=Xylophilus ampelinus TaxID=54067 RepID=A0A318SLC2_9BURK|nr:ATP-binding protein [Xylophilus ampelinus]MCS4510462.1 ATP-binding protein [Xylophilus ampelinus]PYE77918.1 phospho-acceptor domain-containing protein [Xylophilus ampelinus]
MDAPSAPPEPRDLQALRAALAARDAELAAVRAELEDFFRVASHDLRAPLRHLKAFGQLLRERVEDLGRDPETLSFLDTMERSAQQMARMVDGLLELSRIGRAPLVPQPLDVAALVQEARQALALPPQPVAWRVAADIPRCLGDPVLVRLALQHLLSNAVKFSAKRPAPEIAVGWQLGGEGQIEIVVRDNGAGFNPAAAGKLFGVFERLHSSAEFDGLGIGLAAVRRIAQRHGGTAQAEGQRDAGCTVRFSLPAVVPA